MFKAILTAWWMLDRSSWFGRITLRAVLLFSKMLIRLTPRDLNYEIHMYLQTAWKATSFAPTMHLRSFDDKRVPYDVIPWFSVKGKPLSHWGHGNTKPVPSKVKTVEDAYDCLALICLSYYIAKVATVILISLFSKIWKDDLNPPENGTSRE